MMQVFQVSELWEKMKKDKKELQSKVEKLKTCGGCESGNIVVPERSMEVKEGVDSLKRNIAVSLT